MQVDPVLIITAIEEQWGLQSSIPYINNEQSKINNHVSKALMSVNYGVF